MFEERIREAVVDTSPLFSVLVLNYVDSAGLLERWRSKLIGDALKPYLLSAPNKLESFMQLIRGMRLLMTTSHVVGELPGLVRRRLGLYGQSLADFWLSSMRFLSDRGLQEELLTLLAMYRRQDLREAVSLFGVTDVGVVELARRKGVVLLTDDLRLASHAWAAGVDCRLTEHLV